MSDLRRADWRAAPNISGLIASYNRRYGAKFWKMFEELIGKTHRERVIEFGCGPGLFLVDCVSHLGTTAVCGIDASKEMLDQAREFLSEVLSPVAIELISTDLDQQLPSIPSECTDLVFMGFLVHELDHPESLLKLVHDSLVSNGVCVVFDYVSGNQDAFVQSMTKLGMSVQEACKRYSHMCRNSIDDIDRLLGNVGLKDTRYVCPDEFRVLICGTKL